jgi:hypothetical protein
MVLANPTLARSLTVCAQRIVQSMTLKWQLNVTQCHSMSTQCVLRATHRHSCVQPHRVCSTHCPLNVNQCPLNVFQGQLNVTLACSLTVCAQRIVHSMSLKWQLNVTQCHSMSTQCVSRATQCPSCVQPHRVCSTHCPLNDTLCPFNVTLACSLTMRLLA